jgi:hypothetical protein
MNYSVSDVIKAQAKKFISSKIDKKYLDDPSEAPDPVDDILIKCKKIGSIIDTKLSGQKGSYDLNIVLKVKFIASSTLSEFLKMHLDSISIMNSNMELSFIITGRDLEEIRKK